MFFIVGVTFLALLSLTLFMLWGHEKLSLKKSVPRAKVEEYWPGDERREHTRFKNDLEVEYNIEKKAHINNNPTLLGVIARAGKIVNISKGGMKLTLDEKLPNGSIIDLKIYIPEKKSTIEIEGEIVWTKEVKEVDPSGKRFFHSGIKFTGILEPSGINLSKYIDSLHG